MKASFSERFRYWFDTQMSKGTKALIKILVIATLLAVVVLSVIAIALGYSEENFGLDIFWQSFSTIINACWPDYEADSLGYLIVMAVGAVIGLLVTSILIGIISAAIEEKVSSLKDGKSKILETGHTVILGFIPGEYTLLNQLILSTGKERRCIVIGADMDTEEMKDLVYDNVEVPKNVKLVFRNTDIFDPVSLEKVSLGSCRNVIINPMGDKETAKALLAVSAIINNVDNDKIRVDALIGKSKYEFPETFSQKHNVSTIQMHSVIARMIAHSCTQAGLSDTFREIFSFEGNEFHTVIMPEAEGLSFSALASKMDDAVPAGFVREGQTFLNPAPEILLKKDDKIIVFSEEADSAKFVDAPECKVLDTVYTPKITSEKVAIVGYNSSFARIIRELPDNVSEVIVAGARRDEYDAINAMDSVRETIKVSIYEKNLGVEENLLEYAKLADHVVLLSDYDKQEDDSDLDVMFYIMRFRDIRARFGLDFNITAEMGKKSNQNLMMNDEHFDYVVASNMSSIFLAQLSENPDLVDVFKEILSSKGNELYLKKASEFGFFGDYTTAQLRSFALAQRYVFMGYLKNGAFISRFNPKLNETIHLEKDDSLIVIGEN